MAKAALRLATAGIVGVAAIAAPTASQAQRWDPWPWPSEGQASPGPLYTHPGVYAPDALWDAYLRSGSVAPYGDATMAFVPAAAPGDRTIIRVWPGNAVGWHRWRHRHHRHER